MRRSSFLRSFYNPLPILCYRPLTIAFSIVSKLFHLDQVLYLCIQDLTKLIRCLFQVSFLAFNTFDQTFYRIYTGLLKLSGWRTDIELFTKCFINVRCTFLICFDHFRLLLINTFDQTCQTVDTDILHQLF